MLSEEMASQAPGGSRTGGALGVTCALTFIFGSRLRGDGPVAGAEPCSVASMASPLCADARQMVCASFAGFAMPKELESIAHGGPNTRIRFAVCRSLVERFSGNESWACWSPCMQDTAAVQ